MKKLALILFVLAVAAQGLFADTTWVNGGGDSSWSDPDNWSSSLPGTNSGAIIAAQPTNDTIGLDTGRQQNTVGSLTFSAALTGSVSIAAAGVEQLTIAYDLTNSSPHPIKFTLPVAHSSHTENTFTTGGGLEFAGGLNLGTAAMIVTGTAELKLGNGNYTTFAVDNNGYYGLFEGPGTVNYNGTNLQFQILSSSITPGTSYQAFPVNTGTLASVSLVGNYFAGSLAESPAGFYSGYVGGSWWSFDKYSGVFTSGTAPILSITSSSSLTPAISGTSYSQTLSASFGNSPYSWTVTSGTLPGGLSLNGGSGLLSGTPGTTGTFNFTAQVTDSGTNAASKNFNLTVVDPLVISSSTLLTGTTGTSYSQPLSASGGTPSYQWSLFSGSLPGGLSLSGAGVLSGTPTVSGSFAFVVKVTDSFNNVTTKIVSVIILAPLTITSGSPLPSGLTGSPYSKALAASGGYSPYSWAMTGGALPAGVTMDSTGLISGTPAATGTFSFTAQVLDHLSNSTAKVFIVTVVDPVAITSSSPLSTATLGVAYSQGLSATGGTPGYGWSLLSGSLPAGTALGSGGLISGTPTATGTFSFVAKVTDSASLTGTKGLSLTVVAPLTITSSSALASGSVSYPYSQTLSAHGGIPPYSWSVSNGALPSGIALSTAGALSGIPLGSGTFTFTAEVTDSGSARLTKSFTLAVLTPLVPNGALGTFIGLVDRDTALNGGLGGRLDLTTNASGIYSGKITQGAKALGFKGKLNASGSGPQISAVIASGTLPAFELELSFNGASNTFAGTLSRSGSSAAVNGWKRVWDKKANPATNRLGYYSFGLDLQQGDVGKPLIPQGNGFGQFSVAADGGLKVVGKTADGNSISSAGFAGPNGEIAVFQLLYSNSGSVLGKLTLSTGTATLDNTLSGTLTWVKPVTNSRTYAAGFGPLALEAYGKYLAPASNGKLVLGLPTTTGTVQLLFSEGGLQNAALDPSLSFTLSPENKVLVPLAGTPQNPAGTSLKINPGTGVVSGKFTLKDGSLIRKVTYQGIVIRPESGNLKAAGYFLLPQIPEGADTIKTSPIYSGQVIIEQ